jgi:hypothetical protein
LLIPLAGCELFTRRYILRHTALELFSYHTHKSYFFNLFIPKSLQQLLEELRNEEAELILNRQEEFVKREFTQRWRRGELSNFEYLGLVNRYSGRTTNDLGQYPVLPWVMVNFNGRNGFTELDKDYMKDVGNLRDLTIPTGKLSS